ncbi:hypothetical protein BH10BAC1_BH10BAC1_05180 [soil metagenome]
MKPPKIKKILVPFLLKDKYRNSFKVAEEIANKSGAVMTIYSLFEPGFLQKSYTTMVGDEKDENYKKEISAIKEAIVDYSKYLNLRKGQIKIKVEVGNMNEKIIELANKEKFDLIVLPDKQKTPADRMMAEIHPLEIMKYAKCPVISVNRNLNNYRIRKIVVPIRNVSNWFDKIPFVAEIANLTGAEIFLIGVVNSMAKNITTKIDNQLIKCASYFREREINFEISRNYGHGEPYHDVINLAAYKRADLIAVSAPVDYHQLQSYFNNNFYNKIISNGDTPVLGVSMS